MSQFKSMIKTPCYNYDINSTCRYLPVWWVRMLKLAIKLQSTSRFAHPENWLTSLHEDVIPVKNHWFTVLVRCTHIHRTIWLIFDETQRTEGRCFNLSNVHYPHWLSLAIKLIPWMIYAPYNTPLWQVARQTHRQFAWYVELSYPAVLFSSNFKCRVNWHSQPPLEFIRAIFKFRSTRRPWPQQYPDLS